MQAPEEPQLVPQWVVLARVVLAGVLGWVAFALLTLGLMFSLDAGDTGVQTSTVLAGGVLGLALWSLTGVVPLRRAGWFVLAGAVAVPLVIAGLGLT